MVYDDHFSSVPNFDSSGFGEEHRITEEEWNGLIQNRMDHHCKDMDPKLIPNLHNDWLTDRKILAQAKHWSNRKPITVDELDMQHDKQPQSSSSEGDNHDIGPLNDLTKVNDQEPIDDLSLVNDDAIVV